MTFNGNTDVARRSPGPAIKGGVGNLPKRLGRRGLIPAAALCPRRGASSACAVWVGLVTRGVDATGIAGEQAPDFALTRIRRACSRFTPETKRGGHYPDHVCHAEDNLRFQYYGRQCRSRIWCYPPTSHLADVFRGQALRVGGSSISVELLSKEGLSVMATTSSSFQASTDSTGVP